jgi:tetratricopeptide (TPR) repeat protein
MSTCPKCNSKLKTICPNCKKIINTNWRECPNCGQAVFDRSVTHPSPSDIPVETKTQIYSDNVPIETKTQIYNNNPPTMAQQNPEFTNGNIGHTSNEIFKSYKKPYSKKFLASIFAVLLFSSIAVIVLGLMHNVNRYYDEGVSYYNEKNYDEAIKNFEKVVMINPNNEKAREYLAYSWYGKGIDFNRQGMYSEAIICYDKAIEIDPNYANAWNDKGVTLKNQGKYDEAIACYDKAIEINPEYKQAWNNKGIVYFNMGKYSDAIICYDRAIAIDPNYTEAIRNRENAVLRL